jgi:hypothetical protein
VSETERVDAALDRLNKIAASFILVRGYDGGISEEVAKLRAALASRAAQGGGRTDIISLREQAEAWEAVWDLCCNLGMDEDELSGEADLLAFVRSLFAASRAAQEEPVAWHGTNMLTGETNATTDPKQAEVWRGYPHNRVVPLGIIAGATNACTFPNCDCDQDTACDADVRSLLIAAHNSAEGGEASESEGQHREPGLSVASGASAPAVAGAPADTGGLQYWYKLADRVLELHAAPHFKSREQIARTMMAERSGAPDGETQPDANEATFMENELESAIYHAERNGALVSLDMDISHAKAMLARLRAAGETQGRRLEGWAADLGGWYEFSDTEGALGRSAKPATLIIHGAAGAPGESFTDMRRTMVVCTTCGSKRCATVGGENPCAGRAPGADEQGER